MDSRALANALAVARFHLRVCFTHTIGGDGRCTCGRSTCPERSWGKHPIEKSWQKLASDDPDQIRTQFDRVRFEPNVSIVLGEQSSGRYIVALDEDDADRMQALQAEHGELPETLDGRTPRGRRYFFALPAGTPRDRLKNVTGIGGSTGVDLKVSGGQVVVYGRNAGGEYTDFDPSKEIAELPAAWVLSILQAPKPPSDAHQYTPHTLREDGRAKRRYEKYLDRAVGSECSLLSQTKEGQRNTRTLESSIRMFALLNGMHLHTAWAHVRDELIRAGVATGLGEKEVRVTVAQAEKHVVDTNQVRMPREVPREAPSSSEAPAPSDPFDGGESVTGVRLIEDSGSPAKIAENVARMLAAHPRGAPRFNMLKQRAEWPNGEEIRDEHESDLQGWLFSQSHDMRVRCGETAIHAGIILAATRNSFEPVQDYLTSRVWDRQKRIDRFGPDYLETEDSEYAASVTRCFFVGAVARAMKPGCQLDTMLILEGGQGVRKSTALRTLAGEQWFSNSFINMGREPDCYQKLDGVWINEFQEVDAQLSNPSRQQEIKAYVTQREDNYRPSYGRNKIVRLRRTAFVGTTNKQRYLIDETGARRFHGIVVGDLRLEEIARDRDQLWAEAMVLYREGCPWWLTGEIARKAALVAEDRYESDSWEEILRSRLEGKPSITMATALDLLGIDPSKQSRAEITRLGIVMRKLGWHSHRTWQEGCRVQTYSRLGSV